MALQPAGEGDVGAPLGKGGHDLAQHLGIGHGAGDVAGWPSIAKRAEATPPVVEGRALTR